MSTVSLPYGRTQLTAALPDEWQVEVLTLAAAEPVADPLAAVAAALDAPIGYAEAASFAQLAQLAVRPEQAQIRSAAIAVNDKTRPVPLAVLLPPLLARLEGLGLPPAAIRLIIANGAHPPMQPAEYSSILPASILDRYPVLSHDCQEREALVRLGQTGRGTLVWINRHFLDADLRISVGDIEPHQFQGYSGGVKGAAIGLAGKETIDRNHSLMTSPAARAASYYDNPARQDVEEIGRMIGVHLALNAILNEERGIVRVLAGQPAAVMEAALPLAAELFQVPVTEPFDLIITSPGGHPKDINLYQAQKALAHAATVAKEGGCLILVAACPEGAGSAGYERYVAEAHSHADVLERFAGEGFSTGPHKAYQIARDAIGRHVFAVTEQPPAVVRGWLLDPAESLAAAVAAAGGYLPKRPRVGIMPAANVTVPVLPSS